MTSAESRPAILGVALAPASRHVVEEACDTVGFRVDDAPDLAHAEARVATGDYRALVVDQSLGEAGLWHLRRTLYTREALHVLPWVWVGPHPGGQPPAPFVPDRDVTFGPSGNAAFLAARLRALARTPRGPADDGRTAIGLLQRPGFERHCARDLQRFARFGGIATLAAVVVQAVDTRRPGAPEPGLLLETAGMLLRHALRDTDEGGVDGDCLLAWLRGTRRAGAHTFALRLQDRFRAALAAMDLDGAATLTLGLVEAPGDTRDWPGLLQRVRRRLAEAMDCGPGAVTG